MLRPFQKCPTRLLDGCNRIPQSVIHVCHRVHERSWRTSSRDIYETRYAQKNIINCFHIFREIFHSEIHMLYIYAEKRTHPDSLLL